MPAVCCMTLRYKSRHRLVCGDSTSKEDVDLLMQREKADMVFTDPPYGMNLETDYSNVGKYNGTPKYKFQNKKSVKNGTKYKPVLNDEKQFDASLLLNMSEEIFLWGADYYAHSIPQNSGSWIVWDKSTDESLDKMIGSSFELCWSKQKHKRLIARIKWRSLFGMEKEPGQKRVHPTQKPVALAEWFFERWGQDKKIVADLFGGSGSTLIACEKTGRHCRMAEIDPHYCSVIIERFQQFSGEKAVRLND